MTLWLKQSTEVIARLGPFIDKTDGFTEETGLAGAGTEISKNHGAFAAGPTLGTHDAEGWYPITLTTTHTNTLGPLIVKAHDSATHLPVWCDYMVLPANIYDSLVGGSDKLDVNVEEWNATAVPAEHTAGYPICTVKDGTGTGEIDTNAGAVVSVTTCATATNVTTVNGLAANVITAASINADAITAAKIADGAIDAATFAAGAINAAAIATGAIDADALAADAVAEIADGVWDEDATAHQTGGTFGQAIGDPGADTTTIYQSVVTDAAGANVAADIIAVKADTAAILVDTAEIGAAGAGLTAIDLPDQTMNITGNITGNLSGSVGSVTGAVGSVTGAVGSVTGAVGSVTGNVSGNVVGSVGSVAAGGITAASIATGAVDADALAADAVAEIADGVWDEPVSGHSTSGTYGEHHYLIYSGQCSGATSTTTLVDSGLTQPDTDHWKGRVIIFLDGNLKFQATDITGFTPASDTLTFTALTNAPTAGPGGTRYIIV